MACLSDYKAYVSAINYKRAGTKKLLVNIVCGFIVNDDRRRAVRRRMLGRVAAPQAPAGADKDAVELSALRENIKALQGMCGQTSIDMRAWINRNMEKKLSTALMHQKTFLPFKAIHSGQDIVIVATGPSLNDFRPMDNMIYIGVNNSFLNEALALDYLFAQDYQAVAPYVEKMNAYRPQKCIKFYGLTTEFDSGFNRVIPESHAIAAKAHRYRTDWEDISSFSPDFAYDISAQSLGCFGSVVFPAIQFALWTNPKRIFLVGCDCSDKGHFCKRSTTFAQCLIPAWQKLKEFAAVYYPGTEIISVNPVGLRGIFTDLDQKDEKNEA